MKILPYQPLIFLEDGLLCYKQGNLNLIDPVTLRKIWSIDLPLGFKEKWVSRIELFRRLLRLGIRNAHRMDDTLILFVNKRFYEFNLETKELYSGFIPPIGIRALNITTIKGIPGFNDMVVFGGYLSNPNKKNVSIYCRKDKDRWDEIFTFREGEINHIHNIIPDAINRCVWIQTGDFGNASAIWMAQNNFKDVQPIIRGTQSVRGCVAFPTEKGLLYATDTPLDNNSIRILEKTESGWESRELAEIPGSCIYGTKMDNRYVFATTVEPSGETGGIKGLLSTERGPGIRDNHSHVFIGSISEGFKEIYKVKKDFFPYALFQFGTIQFPVGKNLTKSIFAFHTSTSKHGGKTLIISTE